MASASPALCLWAGLDVLVVSVVGGVSSRRHCQATLAVADQPLNAELLSSVCSTLEQFCGTLQQQDSSYQLHLQEH